MPTITVPIEDLVFVLAALVGGGLLLITVLVDDVLGGIFDALHLDFSIGGVSLMPPLLAFVAMFGVGGIFATQVLDVSSSSFFASFNELSQLPDLYMALVKAGIGTRCSWSATR